MEDSVLPDVWVTLSGEDIDKCLDFAEKAFSKGTQSQRNFGGRQRSKNEFLADQVEGKLAEIAAEKRLRLLGHDVKLDFSHYGTPKKVDSGDLYVDGNNVRIDVKGTSVISRWLLVEDYKADSDIYILVQFSIWFPGNRKLREDPYQLKGKKLQARIAGWALKEDFDDSDTGEPLIVLRRNQRIPNPDSLPDLLPSSRDQLRSSFEKIQRLDEYLAVTIKAQRVLALPIKWLRTDLEALAKFITEAGNGRKNGQASPVPVETPLIKPTARKIPDAKHSAVIFPGDRPMAEVWAEVLELLKSGASVYVQAQELPPRKEFVPFLDSRLLQVYRRENDGALAVERSIVDGVLGGEEDLNLLQQLSNCQPLGDAFSFNPEQYLVEHAPQDGDCMVMAGAGTGKTETMVRRVLFLLNTVPDLSPRDIVMVTFTNEAAFQMKQRLQQRLIERFTKSGQSRFRQMLEELQAMTVDTLHAFAIQLLKHLGSALGLGQSQKISAFSRERERFFEEALDEILFEDGTYSGQFKELRNYEISDVLKSFDAQCGNRGLNIRDLENMDWGKREYGGAELSTVLRKALIRARQKLQDEKYRSGSLEINDPLMHLDSLRSNGLNPLPYFHHVPRYVFVDEFQDTDNTQIRILSWLRQEFDYRLFVVGDVKQSIYRFRGATHAAFEELKRSLKSKRIVFKEFRLASNYRTGANLLDSMEPLFNCWGRKGWLRYDPDSDRLRPVPGGGEPVRLELSDHADHQDLAKRVAQLVKEALGSPPPGAHPDKSQIAILVRRNKDANVIRKVCEEAGVPCFVKTGDLYRTTAAWDLQALLNALTYPSDPVARSNLMASSFMGPEHQLSWRELLECDGDHDRLISLQDQKLAGSPWSRWLREARLMPALALLRAIISAAKPAREFFRRRLMAGLGSVPESQAIKIAEAEARLYQGNLERILELLRKQFSPEISSLHTLRDYLEDRRAKHREEPQVVDGSGRTSVICMTVHQAKGLEFDTVIIPARFSFALEHHQSRLLLQKQNVRWRAGWRIKFRDQVHWNDIYDDLKREELSETYMEEARLLYVAFTRAKRRLWVVASGAKHQSWREIVEAGASGGGRVARNSLLRSS